MALIILLRKVLLVWPISLYLTEACVKFTIAFYLASKSSSNCNFRIFLKVNIEFSYITCFYIGVFVGKLIKTINRFSIKSTSYVAFFSVVHILYSKFILYVILFSIYYVFLYISVYYSPF